MRPYEFAGGVAVVTGAASGIGAALAVELGRRGQRNSTASVTGPRRNSSTSLA